MKKILFALPLTFLLTGTTVATASTLSLNKQALKSSENSEMKDLLRWFKKFEKGVKLEGTVTQGVSKAVGFDPTTQSGFVFGEEETQNYGVEVYYENGKRNGTALIHHGNFQDMETLIDEIIVYEDEDGYAYSEYLDHTNTIQRDYKIEDMNKLSFASSGLYNIFKVINDDDITYNASKKHYDLDHDKASIFAKNVLGHQNDGYLSTVKDAYFDFANNEIELFTLIMDPIYREEEQVATQYTNRVTFKFSDALTCKIPYVEKYEAKAENQRLNTAFKQIGDNLTLNITKHIKSNDVQGAPEYAKYEFDGTNIKVHKYENPADENVLNPETDYVLQPIDAEESLFALVYNPETQKFDKESKKIPGFADSFQGEYFYEDLLPKVNEISADFFTYNADVNEYVCKDANVLEQINRLFFIGKSPFTENSIDYAKQVGIRIKNGAIDYVKYYVDYMDPFTGVKNEGEIYLRYSKLGSTQF